VTRRTVAAGVAGVALFAGGVVVANQDPGVPSFATDTTTQTVVTSVTADVPPPPPCLLVRWDSSMVNDPCATQVDAWRASFRNGLATMAYYKKWKAANPAEYQRMKAYATSPYGGPQPQASTAFGAVVRWGAEQCRTWAITVVDCAIP